MLESASTAQRVQVGPLPGVVHTRGAAGGPDIGMVGQRPHHREDGAVLQKGQLAGAEVIEQCAKRLWSNRHLWVQPPAAIRVEQAFVNRGSLTSLRGRRHGQ